MWLNADMTTDLDSTAEISQLGGFQGTRLDANIGNDHSRCRQRLTTLGRWTQQDSAGYVDGVNRYHALGSSPLGQVDPLGLRAEGQRRTEGEEVPSAGGTIDTEVSSGIVKVWKNATVEGPGFVPERDVIFLEYRSANCEKCHWLQFVYAYKEKFDKTWEPGIHRTEVAGEKVYEYFAQKDEKGNISNRYVDSNSFTEPLYDESGAAHIRSGGEISMFDLPSAVNGEANHRRVGQVFDAFLVCSGKVVYHVHWERNRSRKLSFEPLSDPTYENITGGPASSLPEWARGAKLPGAFKDISTDKKKLEGQITYDNPTTSAPATRPIGR